MRNMQPQQPYIFLDRYRLRQSLIVGTVVTLSIQALVTPKEALSIGMLAALLVDVVRFFRAAWSFDYN